MSSARSSIRQEQQSERYEITVDVEPAEEAPDANAMQIEDMDQTAVRLKSAVTKRKGRGFSSMDEAAAGGGLASVGHFETLEEESSGRALRSVEGWVLFVGGLHEEVTQEDLLDKFSDYGPVIDLKLPLNHRTGYVKGYALVEYGRYSEALAAIQGLNESEYMDSRLVVDFAFVRPPMLFAAS